MPKTFYTIETPYETIKKYQLPGAQKAYLTAVYEGVKSTGGLDTNRGVTAYTEATNQMKHGSTCCMVYCDVNHKHPVYFSQTKTLKN